MASSRHPRLAGNLVAGAMVLFVLSAVMLLVARDVGAFAFPLGLAFGFLWSGIAVHRAAEGATSE